MTHTEFIAILGSKIASLRKMRGLNQFEFADSCGKMVNTISKIERGIGDPRLSTLMDMAKALDVSIGELLDGKISNQFKNSKEQDIDKQIIELLKRCDDDDKFAILTMVKALIK